MYIVVTYNKSNNHSCYVPTCSGLSTTLRSSYFTWHVSCTYMQPACHQYVQYTNNGQRKYVIDDCFAYYIISRMRTETQTFTYILIELLCIYLFVFCANIECLNATTFIIYDCRPINRTLFSSTFFNFSFIYLG